MPFTFHPRLLAAVLRDCPVRSSPLACRLDSYLHALYVLAIVLTVVLVAVIVVAVSLYRNKKPDKSDGSDRSSVI